MPESDKPIEPFQVPVHEPAAAGVSVAPTEPNPAAPVEAPTTPLPPEDSAYSTIEQTVVGDMAGKEGSVEEARKEIDAYLEAYSTPLEKFKALTDLLSEQDKETVQPLIEIVTQLQEMVQAEEKKQDVALRASIQKEYEKAFRNAMATVNAGVEEVMGRPLNKE